MRGFIVSIRIVAFSILVILIFVECKQRPSYEADISEVDIEPVEIKRYEKVLFEINPFNLREEIDPYIDDYNLFLGDGIDNPMVQQQLYDYITDPAIVRLYDKTIEVFPDLEDVEAELTTALLYYNYHFPGKEIPEFYSYISGLNVSDPIKYSKNHEVVISLDMYLGKDYEKYSKIGIPSYLRMRRAPEFLVRDVIKKMAEVLINEDFKPNSLIEHMVYEGIKLYFIDCMMPNYHDTLKIAYTSEQELWMKNSQGHVWSYFVDNQLLFSADRSRIKDFINEAPFTSPFSRDSAPRVAEWIGWQMVREYMRRNSDVELSELLDITDAEKILNKSRYKP